MTAPTPLRALVDRLLEAQQRARYLREVADGYWPKVMPPEPPPKRAAPPTEAA